MKGAYYNEFHPRMAAWLRGLISQGLIAPGEVDSRSILEVKPDDLKGFTQCHFFAGLGGWSYALRLAGFPDDRPVWTGSCPCQPFSAAGKRKGFADERHLWPAWHRLIAERRPAKVYGEQVARLPDWLRLVRGDLEALGYAVGAIPMEAASAGAYHLRERFYFFGVNMGDAESLGRERGQDYENERRREFSRPDTGAGSEAMADPAGAGPHARALPGIHRGEESRGSRDGESKRHGGALDMADADRSGLEKRERTEIERGDLRDQGPAAQHGSARRDGLADASGNRKRKPRKPEAGEESQGPLGGRGAGGGALNVENADRRSGERRPRLGHDLRAAQGGEGADVDYSGRGSPALSWAIGAGRKARPVEPGIRLLAHAVSGRLVIQRTGPGGKKESHEYARAQAIEGFGNAIDPVCAAAFIRAAEEASLDF